MRTAILLFAFTVAASCAPHPVPPSQRLPLDDFGDDFSYDPGLGLHVTGAERRTDHLVVTLAVDNSDLPTIDPGSLKAFFTDTAGRSFQAMSVSGNAVVGGAEETVTADFDMAFATEGPGRLRIEGLPVHTIPMTWSRTARPPSRAEAFRRKAKAVLGVIAVFAGIAAYFGLQLATDSLARRH
jgi:hypothetical protein